MAAMQQLVSFYDPIFFGLTVEKTACGADMPVCMEAFPILAFEKSRRSRFAVAVKSGEPFAFATTNDRQVIGWGSQRLPGESRSRVIVVPSFFLCENGNAQRQGPWAKPTVKARLFG